MKAIIFEEEFISHWCFMVLFRGIKKKGELLLQGGHRPRTQPVLEARGNTVVKGKEEDRVLVTYCLTET